ncbi:hypothetical protein L9F63_019046, partial [Diploptera punctata]
TYLGSGVIGSCMGDHFELMGDLPIEELLAQLFLKRLVFQQQEQMARLELFKTVELQTSQTMESSTKTAMNIGSRPLELN